MTLRQILYILLGGMYCKATYNVLTTDPVEIPEFLLAIWILVTGIGGMVLLINLFRYIDKNKLWDKKLW